MTAILITANLILILALIATLIHLAEQPHELSTHDRIRARVKAITCPPQALHPH